MIRIIKSNLEWLISLLIPISEGYVLLFSLINSNSYLFEILRNVINWNQIYNKIYSNLFIIKNCVRVNKWEVLLCDFNLLKMKSKPV